MAHYRTPEESMLSISSSTGAYEDNNSLDDSDLFSSSSSLQDEPQSEEFASPHRRSLPSLPSPPHTSSISAAVSESQSESDDANANTNANANADVEDGKSAKEEKGSWRRWLPDRDFTLYLIFVVVATLATVGSARASMWDVESAIRVRFADDTGLDDVGDLSSYFAWVADGVLPSLLPSKTPGEEGEEPSYPARMGSGTVYPSAYDVLVGRVRIRQVRVDPNRCKVYSGIKAAVSQCYSEYDEDIEIRVPFTPNNVTYPYFSAASLGTSRFWAELGWIGGGGYALDLPPILEDAVDAVKALEGDGWADERTRAILLDFTLYNPGVNVLAVVRLTAEFSVKGIVVPHIFVGQTEMYRYVTSRGVARAFLEVGILVLTCGLVYNVVDRIRRKGKFALRALLTWHEITLSCLWTAWAVTRVVHFVQVANVQAMNDMSIHRDYHALASTYYAEDVILCFALGLLYMGLLRFAMRIHITALYASVLLGMAKATFSFTLVFFIFYLAFVFGFFFAFHKSSELYQTVGDTAVTMLQNLFNEADFDALVTSDRVLGPLLFSIFVLVMMLLMFNLLIAVVSDAFDSTATPEYREAVDARVAESNMFGDLATGIASTLTVAADPTAPPPPPRASEKLRRLEAHVGALVGLVQNMSEQQEVNSWALQTAMDALGAQTVQVADVITDNQNDTLAEVIRAREDLVTTLQDEVASMTPILDESRAAAAAEADRRKSMERYAEMLSRNVATLQEEKSRLDHETRETQGRILDLQRSNMDLESQLSSMSEKLTALHAENEDAQRVAAEALAREEKATAQQRELAAIHRLQVTTIRRRLRRIEETAAEEVANSQTKVDRLKAELDDAVAAEAKFREEIETRRAAEVAKDEELHELRVELAQLRPRYDSLLESETTQQTTINSLRADLLYLESQLDIKTQIAESSQSRLDNTRRRLQADLAQGEADSDDSDE